ncbi:ATP-binding protein [Oleiharenicola lentus]|uniref:hybrid sensor histidine kinase/response regulator n=1 Tax=Oleiharenicola lentus TaxID=2508720 RepID=UPI003F678D0D
MRRPTQTRLIRYVAYAPGLTHSGVAKPAPPATFPGVSLHRLLFSLLLVSFALGARAQETPPLPPAPAGRPYVHLYPPSDYEGHAQIWSTVQDSRGLRYFGNASTVFIFDGVTWRSVDVRGATYVRSLAITADDTVYLSGSSEIGYIKPDATGTSVYTSLRPHLPEAVRDQLGNFFATRATPQGVFFSSQNYLVRWHEGRIHWWRLPEATSSNLNVYGDDIYIHVRRVGLFLVKGDALERVDESQPILAAGLIRAILPMPDGSRLVLSGSHGLVRWRPGESCTVWKTDLGDGEPLADLFPAGALFLPDGNIAINTVRGGLIVITPEGRLAWRLDDANGLATPSVFHMFLDPTNTLWLGTSNGIARVETGVPVRFYGVADGLPRVSLRRFARHEGKLYAASAKDLFILDENNLRFTSLTLTGESYTVQSHPAGLLVGADRRIYWLQSPGKLVQVAEAGGAVTDLEISKLDPSRVWAANRSGLHSLRWDGQAWIDEGSVFKLEDDSHSVIDVGDGTLWLGTALRGLARLRFSPTPAINAGVDAPLSSQAATTILGVEAGFPDRHGQVDGVLLPNRTVLAVTGRGFYELTPDGNRVQPLKRFGDTWTEGHATIGNAVAVDDNVLWFDAAPVTNGQATGPKIIGRATATGTTPRWDALPLYVAKFTGALTTLYHDPSNPADPRIWFGGTNGLASVDPRWVPMKRELPVLVRRARTLGGRQLFTGVTVADAALPPLPYSERDLRFEFSAPLALPDSPVEYSVQLTGLDDDWSAWQRDPFKEFTNLPEGRYTFRVRARQEGVTGAEASWAFTVQPPATRTPLAYALYVLAAAGLIFAIVRWRLAASERERTRLEKIVTERTAELVVARDQAEAASRAKGAFLASMSHELRTPLHIILGYTRVLGRHPGLDATARTQLNSLGASGDHLLRLINEVLDLAQVEAGKLTLRPGPCDLPRLVATLANLFRPQATDKGLTLNLELDSAVPASVLTDEQKLAQILFNLLGNAVKFTSHGHITLRVTATPSAKSEILFEVIDTGPGLTPAEQAQLFQPFAQTAAGAAAGGTGLGLALSTRLVALLGGELQLASTPGQGSTFSFALALPIAAHAPVIELPPIIGHTGTPRQVIVVDDHPANRDILSRQLTPAGLRVRTASTGAEALALHLATPADLMIVDLRMAPMDGFALARALRTHPENARLKILALSASFFDSEEPNALAAGCDAFLPKPCAEDVLFNTISRLLAITWQRETPAPVASGPSAFDATTLNELRELAERGAIARLQTRFAELRAANPALAPLCQTLATLAAGYHLEQLRAHLATLTPAP